MKAENEGLLGQLLALERAGDGASALSAGSCTLCGRAAPVRTARLPLPGKKCAIPSRHWG